MTDRALKLTHRVLLSLVAIVAVCVLVVHLAGATSRSTVLHLLLTVELPLALLVLLVTIWRVYQIRRASGASGAELLVLLQDEEPALRAAITEARTFASLFALLGGRRYGVRGGVQGFGYAKGSMAVPVVMTALTVFETALIHLLVPWQWLRIALLVAALYALVLVVGLLASRVVNPHLVGGGRVVLKWGHQVVLDAPLSNIASVAEVSDHSFTQPVAEGDRLVLTALTSTNVRLAFTEAVPGYPPVPKRRIPANFVAHEVLLYVADASAFVRAVREQLPKSIAEEAPS